MTQVMKKYADVVRAYLDGAEVQCRFLCNDESEWLDVIDPTWGEHYEYRIKPKEPRTVEKFIPVGFIKDELGSFYHVSRVHTHSYILAVNGVGGEYPVITNIKLRCNEETGEVISVELVK